MANPMGFCFNFLVFFLAHIEDIALHILKARTGQLWNLHPAQRTSLRSCVIWGTGMLPQPSQTQTW
jgi:hypothetical protein